MISCTSVTNKVLRYYSKLAWSVGLVIRPAGKYFPRKLKNDSNRNGLDNTTVKSYMLNMNIIQIFLYRKILVTIYSLGRTVLLFTVFWKMNIRLTGVY